MFTEGEPTGIVHREIQAVDTQGSNRLLKRVCEFYKLPLRNVGVLEHNSVRISYCFT